MEIRITSSKHNITNSVGYWLHTHLTQNDNKSVTGLPLTNLGHPLDPLISFLKLIKLMLIKQEMICIYFMIYRCLSPLFIKFSYSLILI